MICSLRVTHRVDELRADDFSQVKLEPAKTGLNQYFLMLFI